MMLDEEVIIFAPFDEYDSLSAVLELRAKLLVLIPQPTVIKADLSATVSLGMENGLRPLRVRLA